MPIAAVFAEEAALALAAELAPYAAGEAALAASSLLGAEALMGLGAEALGTSAIGGAEALATSEAMAANAASGGAGAGAANINAAQVAAQQNAAAQVANAGINAIPEAAAEITAKGSFNPSTGQFINTTLPPEPVFQNIGGQGFAQPQTFPVSGIEQVPGFQGATAGPQGASPGFFNPSAAPGQGPMQYQLNAPTGGQGMRLGSSLETITAPTARMTSVLPPPSGLEAGFDKALKFAEKNPFTAMTGAYIGANMLGLMNPSGATFNSKPYDGPLSRYRLSPDFQSSNVNPADFQYKPRYAEGGIMGGGSYDASTGYVEDSDVPEYARGGSLSDSISQYQKMLGGQQQAAPAASRDVGIYYDQDPDTRYQDALTAAQIRQSKVNQRAYVSAPAAKRPMPMGKLNMPTSAKSKDSGDVEAAQGGIMQSSLGGYAAGGNPRLLKGPGDGMSDNIPATINGRQPARLADGEFVIPADVVSHLGNGSTEAGAKQLHAMMNKVRSARTGNSKQGKQIVAEKYLPKKKRA
jgi:hypothetical protein